MYNIWFSYLSWFAAFACLAVSVWYFVREGEVPKDAEIVRTWDGREIGHEIDEASRLRRHYRRRALTSGLIATGLSALGLANAI
jgi:hypothetical protein